MERPDPVFAALAAGALLAIGGVGAGGYVAAATPTTPSAAASSADERRGARGDELEGARLALRTRQQSPVIAGCNAWLTCERSSTPGTALTRDVMVTVEAAGSARK